MHKNIKQNDYSRYATNRDVISLFSGAMGLDIGLGKAGLNVVIGQDFDAACVKTMKANGHKVLGGDIREIQPQQLLDMTGLAVGEPFLICGGPPCQPFSTAGKRLGINDPRGSLFMDFIRMIDYIRPRFFVMENVKGIMSSPLKHVPLSERDESDPEQKLGTVLDVILSEFDKLGYKTVFWSLAYVDWYVDNQPTREEALEKLLPRVHPGAVILLHSTSKTNAEILDEFLTTLEEQGYTFGTLNDIV